MLFFNIWSKIVFCSDSFKDYFLSDRESTRTQTGRSHRLFQSPITCNRPLVGMMLWAWNWLSAQGWATVLPPKVADAGSWISSAAWARPEALWPGTSQQDVPTCIWLTKVTCFSRQDQGATWGASSLELRDLKRSKVYSTFRFPQSTSSPHIPLPVFTRPTFSFLSSFLLFIYLRRDLPSTGSFPRCQVDVQCRVNDQEPCGWSKRRWQDNFVSLNVLSVMPLTMKLPHSNDSGLLIQMKLSRKKKSLSLNVQRIFLRIWEMCMLLKTHVKIVREQ